MALLPDTLPAGPVRLDRWCEGQLDELMAAISLSYEELHRWMPWADSMPTAEVELKVLTIGVEAFEDDFEWQYLVRETCTGALVGGAGLRRRSCREVLEVGYWTRSDRTGRGYATAAACALTSAAFTHVRAVDAVEIHTDAANAASAAIPPKLGFALARVEPRPPETRGATGNFLVWEARRGHWASRVEVASRPVEFRIEQVADQATWELRRAVLRPHQGVEHLAESDRDPAPGSAAFAALDPEGTVAGTVRVAPGAPPPPLDVMAGPGRSWRLRGMAVRPELRNLGLGTRLVSAAADHAEGQGGRVLWCNARVPAIGLYRRAGFVVAGEPWEEPDIGPHVVMWRTLGR